MLKATTSEHGGDSRVHMVRSIGIAGTQYLILKAQDIPLEDITIQTQDIDIEI
jgi:hypothetical protein